MAEYKLVLADPKTGKCYQREIKDAAAKQFIGMKIGDKLRGEIIDLTGYEFEICGGSDNCGFPMRKDLEGSAKRKILSVGGIGMSKLSKGIRQKKTVCGNTIHEKTAQINLKILKHGTEKLGGEEKPAEAAKVEKPTNADDAKPAESTEKKAE